MFEHINPERKTEHHSETTGIILHGLETIYVAQVMIKILLTVLASQRESVLSAEQVSSVFEYGKNTMLFTESAWPRNVCRHRSLQGKEMDYELVYSTTLETSRFDTRSFGYKSFR